MLLKKSYRMTSPRFSLGMQETVKSIISALDILQGPGSETHEVVVGGSLLKKESARKMVGGTCA